MYSFTLFFQQNFGYIDETPFSGYTQKLRIDIPLYNYNPDIDPSIKGASGCLQSASEELEKSNFHGTLINMQ
jgi:hypothetical protein